MKEAQNRKPMESASRRKKRIDCIVFVCLLLIGLIFIIPFVWMAVVAFERSANIQPPFPPSLIVKEPSLFNFKIITENGNLWRAYRNSLVIAVFSVALNMLAVMLGGYALAKGRFKGKGLVLVIVMATMIDRKSTRLNSSHIH